MSMQATMLDEIERAVILCNKADEYDVPALTDDEEKQCASKAEDYMASIGEDIAAQFSVEQSAVLAIYEKDALSMKVYNQILENLQKPFVRKMIIRIWKTVNSNRF